MLDFLSTLAYILFENTGLVLPWLSLLEGQI